MSIIGIQGQLLEITVVGCNKLKDTEWISRQDPYVCVEYGSSKFRTRTCTDGHKTPIFQEKFVFTLIEGLREINVAVWNSNTLTVDDFIGSGKVQLQKALSQGFDDSTWTLQTKTGRYAGEVRLILHYSNALKPASSFPPSAPPYGTPPIPQVPSYSTYPAACAAPYAPSAYPAPSTAPYAPSAYPAPSTAPFAPSAYPAPSPYSAYPPNAGGYPPSLYSAPPPSTYPPPPYPPTSTYPPPPYPPPPQASPYYPPGPYPGTYPPPPY